MEKMKKIVFSLLTLMLIFSVVLTLAACGKCDHNGGVCVLTGRALTEVRAGKTSPLTKMENQL